MMRLLTQAVSRFLLGGLFVALLPCVAPAATSIDLLFAGTGTSVTSGTGSGFSGTVVMNVILTTDDGLTIGSVSISWDNIGTSAVAGTHEWFGVGIFMGTMQISWFKPFVPTTIDNTNLIITALDGGVPSPNDPPNLPAGSYQLGTIVWHTTGAAGDTNFQSVITGFDGFLIKGINITSSVDLGGATFNIGDPPIPEPGTAGLLLFGMLGLTFAARNATSKRKRS